MKRTTIAYLLVTVLGVALFAVGLLNVQSHFLPMAASDVMAPLGGHRLRPGRRGPVGPLPAPIGPGAAAAGEGAQ